MTTITLPPDLEARLEQEAGRLGTTPELLAVESLRRLFVPPCPPEASGNGATLYDFLQGHIGVIASGEIVPGGARLSENTGKKFTDGLVEKHRQGKL